MKKRLHDRLQGKRVAFLVANEGVEQVELTEPLKAVRKAGAEAELLAPAAGQIQGFNHFGGQAGWRDLPRAVDVGRSGCRRAQSASTVPRPAVGWRSAGLLFADAPVLGTKQPAEEGELVILASGPEELWARLEPIFDAIGKRTMWVGEAGAGSRLKVR